MAQSSLTDIGLIQKIIDELGAKHQLCTFHIMKNLMASLNKKALVLEKRIETHETKIQKNKKKIDELKAKYSYKQGRLPKNDKKACKNLEDRHQLKKEKSKIFLPIISIQKKIKGINKI